MAIPLLWQLAKVRMGFSSHWLWCKHDMCGLNHFCPFHWAKLRQALKSRAMAWKNKSLNHHSVGAEVQKRPKYKVFPPCRCLIKTAHVQLSTEITRDTRKSAQSLTASIFIPRKSNNVVLNLEDSDQDFLNTLCDAKCETRLEDNPSTAARRSPLSISSRLPAYKCYFWWKMAYSRGSI